MSKPVNLEVEGKGLDELPQTFIDVIKCLENGSGLCEHMHCFGR